MSRSMNVKLCISVALAALLVACGSVEKAPPTAVVPAPAIQVYAAGSLRAASHNKLLVKIAMAGAHRAGAAVTYLDLRDYPLRSRNRLGNHAFRQLLCADLNHIHCFFASAQKQVQVAFFKLLMSRIDYELAIYSAESACADGA